MILKTKQSIWSPAKKRGSKELFPFCYVSSLLCIVQQTATKTNDARKIEIDILGPCLYCMLFLFLMLVLFVHSLYLLIPHQKMNSSSVHLHAYGILWYLARSVMHIELTHCPKIFATLAFMKWITQRRIAWLGYWYFFRFANDSPFPLPSVEVAAAVAAKSG